MKDGGSRMRGHWGHENNLSMKHIVFFVCLLIVLAVCIEAGITHVIIERNADRSTTLLLSQVEKVLEDNEKDEEEHTVELKETYLSYAQSIAYILDQDPSLVNNTAELKKIAAMQNVDEIHIFDTTGEIVAGTEPQYYGYSFDSGEQMAFFKPMLKDKSLSLCQDVTPNTAEGKSMMYGMVWNPSGTFLVQVGIEPTRFLAELDANDISNVLQHTPLVEGFGLFAIDIATGDVVASKRDELIPEGLFSEYSGDASCFEEGSADQDIIYGGERYFCNYDCIDEYVIAAVYAASESASTKMVPLIVIAAFMLVAGVVIVILFSRLYRANKEVEAAYKAKSNFLFNMSHDIRTPMNAIAGFTRLLKDNKDDSELFDKYIGKIESSSELLLSIINNVLDMARIESGKETVNEEPFDMMEIKQEIIPLFTDQMRERGITFVTESEFEHRYIYADGTKLKTIYLNLLSNACKYTPAGGTVSMTSREYPGDKPGYIVIETVIEDTGIGMSEEFQKSLFEPFSRERTTTQSKTTGTGLGMAIVKNLVDMMGGTIEVKSELGKGTKFTVRSSRRLVEDSAMLPAEGRKDELSTDLFSGKRILLAEDNELNAEIAVAILEKVGFEVECVPNGEVCVETLQKASVGQYDLILMDIQMPKMNGYEATRTIRCIEDPAKSGIPIIAMTANAFEEDRRDAFEAGMNGHVAKPINVEQLLAQISEVLGG